MKIAFLMQCHKCIEQINVLSEILSSDGDDVYIHFDKKSKENRNLIHRCENVFLLPIEETESVYWGKYSQCISTINLINKSLNSGKRYDYIWLISGQDFPVKSIDFIRNKFKKENGAYIDILNEKRSG